MEQQSVSKKQKIIVGVLATIFLVVLVAAFWDLYGKNMFSKNSQTSNTVTITPVPTNSTNNQPAPSGKLNKQPKNSNIDTSQFKSCMIGLTDKPSCKRCCEGLNLDSTLNETCRKECNRTIPK